MKEQSDTKRNEEIKTRKIFGLRRKKMRKGAEGTSWISWNYLVEEKGAKDEDLAKE